MKFLQTGDWHLGKIFYETSLVEDQRYFLDQIVTELEQAETDAVPYDALAVPGDIYDRAVPPSEAVTLFSDFLNEVHMKFPRLHLFFLSGNHDSSDRLSFAAELLDSQNIHICTDTRRFTEPVIIGNGNKTAAIYQLPYLTPGCIRAPKQIRKNEEQQELFDAESKDLLRSQQQLTEAAVQQIAAAHKKNHPLMPCVLCAHLFTLGSVSSDSERSFTGAAEQVDASVFSFFTYTALGHLHKAQMCGNGTIWYSGSPLAYSFGEEPDKYMLRVTVTAEGACAERIPVHPLHPVLRLTGSFQDLYTNDTSNYKNSYIEIQCTDPVVHENAMSLLRTKFPLIMSFVRTPYLSEGENMALSDRSTLLKSESGINQAKIFDAFLRDIYGEISSDPVTQKEKILYLELAGKENAG